MEANEYREIDDGETAMAEKGKNNVGETHSCGTLRENMYTSVQ